MFGVIALVLASCVEFELGRSQVAVGKVVMQWQYLVGLGNVITNITLNCAKVGGLSILNHNYFVQ